MDAVAVATIAGSATLVTTAIVGGFAWVARVGRRILHKLDEMWEDWYGLPARPGRDRQPGVMERLASIDGQLVTNGGSTLKDTVVRIETGMGELASAASRTESAVSRQETAHQELTGRFEKHLEWVAQYLALGVPPPPGTAGGAAPVS